MNMEWAKQQIETYKTTDHYSLLNRQLSEYNISLSDEALNNLLFFSSDIYARIKNDIANYPHCVTFYKKISEVFYENPILFSILETSTKRNTIKFVMFFRDKWQQIVEDVFARFTVDYKIYDVRNVELSLKAIVFFQTYNSLEEWKETCKTNSSLAQRIQQEVQTKNGITADLFSLYLDYGLRASIAILSPGSILKLLTGRERLSNSFIRTDLQQLFRSSWEANVARLLNYKGIPWKYEERFFELKDGHFYLPDFFLPNNIILEVKGYWDEQSRAKVSRFARDYPEYKLCILDEDMYQTLSALYGSTILGWEQEIKRQAKDTLVPIIGMKYCANRQTIESLSIGTVLQLIMEPDNMHEKNAILVTTEDGSPIGHISSDWAFIYSSKMALGMKYTATIEAIEEKVISARISRVNQDENILYSVFY